MSLNSEDQSIAIIGFAGRFPGARDLDEFWRNLVGGVESISSFTDEELQAAGFPLSIIRHPASVKAGGVLEGIENFDASFFGYSPREAEIIDPQQRLFLECACEALENAGYDPETYDGTVGVFGGVGRNAYLLNLYSYPVLAETSAAQITTGNCSDYVTTRVSYKLNLTGPSFNVQTACSTSLVAVHVACQSILNQECSMALAGGLSINIPQQSAVIYQDGGIISPDGRCRAYDAKAKGIVGGGGGGVVVLKRLSHALGNGDFIHAVIKGSAVNNDGSAKVGFNAPSVAGQSEVILEALEVAGVEPETIGYVEGHGTGTPLGDPIEVSALTKAFRAGTQKRGFCGLGSVKTNLGHLDTGAGVASLIKTTLALKNKVIPPSLNFTAPNPEIDFANSPFFVVTKPIEWVANGTRRRAGVSSFGIGGTNAHVILEEAPALDHPRLALPQHLIVLSAKTGSALESATRNLAMHLDRHRDLDLAAVAYTLQVGRRAYNHRRIAVCRDVDEAAAMLASVDPLRVFSRIHESGERPIVFMFSGQGAQYTNMARELYDYQPVFRRHLDECGDILAPHLKLDLREVLYPASDKAADAEQQLAQTALTQPALFAVEYALARLLMAHGVKPRAMVGHSIGEYAASCLSGVFSLEDALKLVAARGKLMQTLPAGAMMSVPLSAAEVTPLLGPDLSLAAVNAESSCVVSGPSPAVQLLEARLVEKGVSCRILKTSHAFHSVMMTPILEPFTELVKQVRLQPPKIPYLSNVTGQWITAEEATSPGYWATHLRNTVLFDDAVRQLVDDPEWIFLEVGPGNTLNSLVQKRLKEPHRVLSSLRRPGQTMSDLRFFLTTMGRLWLAGVKIAWDGIKLDGRLVRVPLPTYPFERQRYWLDRKGGERTVTSQAGGQPDSDGDPANNSLYQRPEISQPYAAPETDLEKRIAAVWQQRLGIDHIGMHDNFYELGGDSLLATELVAQLREEFDIDLALHSFFDTQTIAGVAARIEEMLISEVADLTEEEAAGSLQ